MRAIARQLGRDQSTVSRELARNRSEGGYYLLGSAQQKMQVRRQQSKTAFSCVSEHYIFEIKQRLKQYHSSKQIAGRMKRDGGAHISHETIYQMIYADHNGLRGYQRYLRQGRSEGAVTESVGGFQGA
jgi:IS30 family transposase